MQVVRQLLFWLYSSILLIQYSLGGGGGGWGVVGKSDFKENPKSDMDLDLEFVNSMKIQFSTGNRFFKELLLTFTLHKFPFSTISSAVMKVDLLAVGIIAAECTDR